MIPGNQAAKAERKNTNSPIMKISPMGRIHKSRRGQAKKDIRETNISLALDSYHDIFSDFDPRPNENRALSVDFLQECIRAARDKSDERIKLRLLMSARSRKKTEELIIKKRLREHFQKHHKRLDSERAAIKRRGALWMAAGTALSLLAAALHGGKDGFLTTLLFVIVEPASWFSFWTGLDKIFLEDSHHASKRQFYDKMAKAEVRFESY